MTMPRTSGALCRAPRAARAAAVGRGRRRAARGMLLIEALVAVLVFSIGVLGLVALQASMTRAQTVSKFRADAAYVANAAIGVLRGDAGNLGNYAAGACAGFAGCADLQRRAAAALPRGTLEIDPDAGSGAVRIVVGWTAADDEPQRYTTSTVVRRSNDPVAAP